MATQTQTLRRPPVQTGRVHDYLYDPLHTLASERDHARATFKAHTGASRVKKMPIFQTMFSELRHHPRQQMRLESTDPVPKFINRQWGGYAEQAREAIVRYKTFNYDPAVKVPAKKLGSQDVSGANRYKYFRRPIIPFLQAIPPNVILASARQDPLMAAAQAEQQAALDRAPTPLTRTIMTQTDYRDSEAQTDPYTPEYVIRPGSQPELLTLATLSHGHGLPAGLAEVEMIERARAKRAWEETLPSLGDMDQLDKRKRMMDEMERKEWALREQEIERLQEARLAVLMKLLKHREENHQQLNTKRLDRLWAKKQKEKDIKLQKIRNEHIKSIRKLTAKRRAVEGLLERRDVVQDYARYGSQTYAPLTRIGVFLDRGSEQYVVKNHYINTYHGLLELENSLPDFVLNPRIQAPKPKTVTKSGFVKRKYRPQMELAEIHQNLKEEKMHRDDPVKPMRFLQKIEKPIPRPATPVVEGPTAEEEERELAVTFLQKVIRGRAIQNMMFEGKEKRIELIGELRSTHALQEAEQQVKKQEKQATITLQRQQKLQLNKESYIDEALGLMEGESLGDTLDFLHKELTRLQEERRIHAFSMLAERQRRIREAEESGRRQVEERRRREQDEMFKQVVKVHQDTVDNYLQDIILSSMDYTAQQQAVQEIQHLATKINDVAYEAEERRDALESEEIVSDLVHGFLLPEAQKTTIRERVQRNQRKHLVAAHTEIFKVGSDLIESNAKPDVGGGAEDQEQQQGEKVFGGAEEQQELQTSRPGSAPRTPSGSRPVSGTGSPRTGGDVELAGSRHGSRQPTPAGSQAGSRPQSAQGSQPASPALQGSRTATPVGSKAATPVGSKPATPVGSKAATPVGSRAATPKGSRAATPTGSKPTTPVGSKPATPVGSKPATPVGSKAATPVGSKPATPIGSRSGSRVASPSGSQAGASAAEDKGSKQATPAGSRSGSRAASQAGSKPPTPVGSKPPTPTGSKPPTPRGSKPGSKAPTPTGSKPTSRQATPAGSRVTSPVASQAGSRPSSAAAKE